MANNVNNGITGVIDIPGALRSRGAADGNQVGGVVAYAGDIYDTTLGKNQSQINQEFSESLSSSSAPTYSAGTGIVISNNTINVDASQLNYDDLNGKPDLDPLIATHDDRGVVLSHANQGAYAIGNQSVAYGHSTNAQGDYSIAGGNGTRAWGDKSVAFGTDTIAWGDNTIAAGNGSIAVGTESVALGEKAYTKGKASGYFGKGRSVSAYVIDSEVGVANSDPWYILTLESPAGSNAGYPDGRGVEEFRVLPGMYITEYGTDVNSEQPGWLIKNVEYIPQNLGWTCKVYIDDPNEDAPSDPQQLVVRGVVSEGYSYALGRYLFTTNQSEVAVGDYNVSHKSGGSAASGSGTIFSVGTGVLSDNSEYLSESMADPEDYLISNQTYRANALEVLTDGSVYVRGVGRYDGKSIANVDSLQTVITDVNTGLTALTTKLNAFGRAGTRCSEQLLALGSGYAFDYTNPYGFFDHGWVPSKNVNGVAIGSSVSSIGSCSFATGLGSTGGNVTSHFYELAKAYTSGDIYIYLKEKPVGGFILAKNDSYNAPVTEDVCKIQSVEYEDGTWKVLLVYPYINKDIPANGRVYPVTGTHGDYSSCFGSYTVAQGESSTVVGTCNYPSTYDIFSVGVGQGLLSGSRSNAVLVTQSGDVYIKGIGNYDGRDYTSAGVKSIQTVISELQDALI